VSEDYLERLIAKAKGNDLWDDLKAAPVPRTEKNSVEADYFDKMSWEWISDQIPVLKKQVDDLGEDFETSPAAYEDLFHLMHKANPRANPEEVLIEEYKPQAMMMGMIGASDELRHLRHETVLDDYNTAYAMLTMRDKMRKAFEDLQDAIDAASAANEAVQQAIQQAQDAMASGEGMEEARQALEAALAASAQARSDAEEQAAEGAASVQGAADVVAKQIEEERTLMSGWGFGPGQLQRMPFEARRALSERLHKSRMAKFAKMIGAQRVSNDAEARRSIRKAPVRTQGMRLGRDISKLTTEELTRMAMPEFEEDFWLRYAKNRLKLKEWADPPALDRGPMIVVCDESYSMNDTLDAEGNTREMWSKAVALSLCDQARRGRRDFFYLGFASYSEQWAIEFPNGSTPIEKVTEFTEHFFGGGTHYERPLRMAMAIVQDYAAKRKPKPDIVFITDDQARVPEEFIAEWAEMREAASVRVYGIQVGGSGEYDTMRHLTDRQLSITRLNASPEGVTEMFRSL
jgi:uncharacterized protein with von Willebrand factor type A (vWA) domain